METNVIEVPVWVVVAACLFAIGLIAIIAWYDRENDRMRKELEIYVDEAIRRQQIFGQKFSNSFFSKIQNDSDLKNKDISTEELIGDNLGMQGPTKL